MRLFTFSIESNDPTRIFSGLANMPYSLWFDSARPDNPLNKFSYICWQPFEMIESKDGHTRVTNREFQLTFRRDPFAVLKERMDAWAARMADDHPSLPPFQGGAAGFFGYDLVRQIERLPENAKPHDLPDMAIGLFDQVIAYEHDTARMTLMIHAADEKTALIKKKMVLSHIMDMPSANNSSLSWMPDCDEAAYLEKIRTVDAYIRAGDIYQACLSRRFTAPRPQGFDSFAHYTQLRRVNPAPFAGYMNFGDFQIGSSSPERFLKVEGRDVETRPIKGTRKAHADAHEDSLIRDMLITSEKDRAENLMITDLLRNDLSKVCERHSVRVPVLFSLESYEGLHHLVSVVCGRLRENLGPVDVMRACFPGGSITGAPKIRAMEILDELESARRGPWCGSMGWIGFNGNMDSNIMIRTVVYTRDEIQIQTGGGIVADSVPETELAETQIKAEKLFESYESNARKKILA